MSEIEKVALWIGLIASVVGIVLSIVAIVFAILVEQSNRAVSEQMIKSLQKIESDVEHSASDTRELIKVGWEKMLGTVDSDASSVASLPAAKEIASGIASELRAELGLIPSEGEMPNDNKSDAVKIEDILRNFEQSLAAQFEAQRLPSNRASAMDGVYNSINSLSTAAKALLIQISRFHLERKQYQMILRGKFGHELREIRATGLYVPVSHDSDQGPVPCYYFQPGLFEMIRASLSLIDTPPREIMDSVKEELTRVEYIRDEKK